MQTKALKQFILLGVAILMLPPASFAQREVGGGGGTFKGRVGEALWREQNRVASMKQNILDPEVLKNALLDSKFNIEPKGVKDPLFDENGEMVDQELEAYVVGKTLQIRTTFDLESPYLLLHELALLGGYPDRGFQITLGVLKLDLREKLENARAMLTAILSTISLEQIRTSSFSANDKDFFIRNAGTDEASNRWIQILKEIEIVPQILGHSSVKAKAFAQDDPKRIEIDVDFIYKNNDLDIAILVGRNLAVFLEDGASAQKFTPDLIFESVRLSNTGANADVRNATQNINAPSQEVAPEKSRIMETMNNIVKLIMENGGTDIGPDAPWMKEMDQNYKAAAKVRGKVWELFLAKLENNYEANSDKNGVLQIRTPIFVEGYAGALIDHFKAVGMPFDRGIGYDHMQGLEGEAYVNALKDVFNSFSGFQVSAAEKVSMRHSTSFGATTHTYCAVFVVPDPEAPAKYEIRRWEVYREVEERTAAIRERVRQESLQRGVEGELLRQLIDKMSEDEFRDFADRYLRSADYIDINLKKIDKSGEQNDFLDGLSREREERLRKLRELILQAQKNNEAARRGSK